MFKTNLLTLITFLPLAGAVLIMLLPRNLSQMSRWLAAVCSAMTFVLALLLLGRLDASSAAMQLVEKVSWIPSFHINYALGVDGLSTPMLLLATLLFVISIVAAWNTEKSPKAFFGLFLVLETGVLGVFTAIDFFLFYIFWEIMLLPMYFLIGIWGGARREYAAIKFFVFTLLGSVLMLLALIMLYRFTGAGPDSFDMVALRGLVEKSADTGWLRLMFIMLFIGFAVKIPVVPLHVWLPDAHVEAPTPVSVILAGILLKLGGYGLFRICYPLFPTTAQFFAPLMLTLGMLGIVYGAFCALAQSDMKKLVAYSSVSHMGFVLLGLGAGNSAGVSGAMYQMVSHGLITAMMFLLVGFIYDRAHHRDIAKFGGLAATMPRYYGLASFTFFAALGLPALSGFVAEVLVLVGAFSVAPWLTGISSFGVVITVGYCLWLVRRVFMGEPNPQYQSLKDLDARELGLMIPLVILVLVLGLYPNGLLNMISAALSVWVN